MDGPPDPDLDRYLDATARCVARFGLRRVSVKDVARELGVDRTTVYRQVGTIRQQLRLLAARDIGRLLAMVPNGEDGPVTADDVVDTLVAAVELTRAHPVMARIVGDDADVVTLADLQRIQATLGLAAGQVAPLVEQAMQRGWFASRDPGAVATWLVSTVAWLVFLPPEGDIRPLIQEIVGPVLNPLGERAESGCSDQGGAP
jgi:AcrR family transcriptional regulator